MPPEIDPKNPKGNAGGDQGDPDPKGKQDPGQVEMQAPELTYKNWMGQQTKEIQALVTENVTGLKSALESERENRKGVETQLRTLAEELEGDHKEAIENMANQLDAVTLQNDFYEDALAEGVNNPKLAFVVAKEYKLIDRKGRVNFDKMRVDFPELFGVLPKGSKGGAGAGLNQDLESAQTMNTLMRKAVGRG